MSDSIEKFFNSLLQHGIENDRVYLMKLDTKKVSETLGYINELANKNSYSKILTKIPAKYFDLFEAQGFIKEAYVPKFFKGTDDCIFASKFLTQERNLSKDKSLIDNVLEVCSKKEPLSKFELDNGFEFDILDKEDVEQITSLYKNVFKTYPFPIFDNDYILETMKDNICYFGIKKEGKLVSVSSSEMDKENLNSEMTDFATLDDFRGFGFASYLLDKMQKDLKKRGFKTAYTIARSISFGMNLTFKKNGFEFAGTLKNNSNISGSIESMNIWYKNL